MYDPRELIKAREFHDLKLDGMAEKDAALQVYGTAKLSSIQETPEFLAVKAAVVKAQQEQLAQDIAHLQSKKVKAYSLLLDKGEELMAEATSLQEKAAAQANQRANLGVGVIEAAMSWNGEDRNQEDLGDILEGVVLP